MNSDHDACLEVRGRHLLWSIRVQCQKIQAYSYSKQIYSCQSSPLTYVTGQLDQRAVKISLNAHLISS